ncbi:MAG: LEA type 2 family protein [Phycisphaeraceae bacterium]|nr:LEA type 2 family protein [Phycisphaeraceae bacterium]
MGQGPTIGFLALLAALLAGCSDYKEPRLSVANVAVAQESPEGLVIAFTVLAENQNNVALPLREVRYALDLDNKRVFEGTRSPEGTVRADGSHRMVIPVALAIGPGSDASDALPERPTGEHRYRLAVNLTYITPGALANVLFDTGVRRPVVSYNESGLLNFGEGPAPIGPGIPTTLPTRPLPSPDESVPTDPEPEQP